MFFQVQLGALIASCGFWNSIWLKVGLGWIVAQSVLSYLVAGVAKARNSGWWNGRAVQNLMRSEGPYQIWQPARQLGRLPVACGGLGVVVILMELAFPAVLFLPMEPKLAFLFGGFLFHATNALVLGLNRFVWAWAATYPALLAFGPA